MDYFRLFFKKIKNHALNFRALDETPIVWENYEKIFQDFFEKST